MNPKALRIAVLGDSFVKALQVQKEHRLTELLEKLRNELSPNGQPSVEVMNFGVSGCGTAQALLTLRYRVAKFRLSVVAFAAFLGKDLMDNTLQLPWQTARSCVIERDGELEFDDSFLEARGVAKSWLRAEFDLISDHVRLA